MKDLIITALVNLYHNGPRDPYLGICNHVWSYIEDLPPTQLSALSTSGGREAEECSAEAEYLMEELFKEWPEFSGSVVYPVPGPEGVGPRTAFHATEDMWTGEYGAKRWALAEFMLRELCK